jgi:signal transduction histidine kinase
VRLGPTRVRGPLGNLRRRPIVTRLVLAVAAAMGVVLLLAAAFVYWRVEYALNRQLDQDLKAWNSVVDRAIADDARPPTGTPGLKFQVYDRNGALVTTSPGVPTLATRDRVRAVLAGNHRDFDLGSFLPPAAHPYRVRPSVMQTAAGDRVVLAAISRNKHDEALRELLLQLAIADVLVLVAASFVGYRTARAALDPVEAYRRAALGAEAEAGGRLPVEERDDELSRLGHTLNDLLERIDAGAERERQFLADAAHELRTPLTLMTSELDWAAHRRRTPEQMEKVIASMRNQVARLVELANALLELEELRSVDSLRREDVAVDELIDDALRAALPRGTPVEVDAPRTPAYVDREWMTIAISNLLRNADRHGEGEILVKATQSETELQIDVRDNGQGFPEDFRQHAFDRFSRAEASRTTSGSGLGLYLVQSVAEAHQGTAEILDGPGGAVRLTVSSARGLPDGAV